MSENTSTGADPTAGAMSAQDLFELVAEEVMLDGVVDRHENKLLNVLARYLGIAGDVALEILKRTPDKVKHGLAATQRPLHSRALYAKTLRAVYADGILDEAEARMLKALRRVFRISDSSHQRMVDALKGGGDLVGTAMSELPSRLTFRELLTRHVAASLDKQQALLELVGPNHAYAVDLERGRIELNGNSYAIQLLGSVAKGAKTWVWSWMEESELPDAALVHEARQLRDLGLEQEIYEFSEPRVTLEGLDPLHLALVASGVCNARAFYRASSAKGDMYVLIVDPSFPRPAGDPSTRVAQLFPVVASKFSIDHESAFRHYLSYYGMQANERLAIVGRTSSGSLVSAVFDEAGRFLRMG